jgi:hypothetical protein
MTLTATLSDVHWDIVRKALGTAPYDLVRPVIVELERQLAPPQPSPVLHGEPARNPEES